MDLRMKIPFVLSIVVMCTLFSGCTGAPKPLRDLDIHRATIAVGDGETLVVIDGSHNKASGAAAGATEGAGLGLGYAAITCISTGPAYPLCLAFLGTFLGSVGLIAGAMDGLITTQSAGEVSTKRSMLTETISALGANQRLAVLLHQKSLNTPIIDPLYAVKDPAILVSEWTLRIVVNEIATVNLGPRGAYLLKVSARVEITHSGSDNPVIVKEYQAQNRTFTYTAGWRANDDKLVRSTVDDLLATLTTDILNDLWPIQLSLDKTLVDYMELKNLGIESPLVF
jgi:hypothetical protein